MTNEALLTEIERISAQRSEPDGVRLAFGALGFKISTIGLLMFIAGYLLLYMDRHNDGRYVQQSTYAADREADKKTRETERASDAKMTEQYARQQEEIQRQRDGNLANQFGGIQTQLNDLKQILLQKQQK